MLLNVSDTILRSANGKRSRLKDFPQGMGAYAVLRNGEVSVGLREEAKEKFIAICEKKRAIFREKNASVVLDAPAPEGAVFCEERFESLTGAAKTRLQIYTPVERRKEALPLYTVMHGGGFICGSSDFDDKYARLTALNVGCKVMSVDYKLAPEYQFPYQLEEGYGAIKWAVAHAEDLGIDPARIMVGGHSAGAGLSTGICAMAQRRKEFALCGQVLDYPPVDFREPDLWEDIPDGFDIINQDHSAFFNACYLKEDRDRTDPLNSTVLIEDCAGFPPALIILAEFDELTAPALEYAEHLRSSGIRADVHVIKNCCHGFMTLPMHGTKEGFCEGWARRWSFMREIYNEKGRGTQR